MSCNLDTFCYNYKYALEITSAILYYTFLLLPPSTLEFSCFKVEVHNGYVLNVLYKGNIRYVLLIDGRGK